MLWDVAEAISIATFRVWKNNIGEGGIKDFFKGGGGGGSKKGGGDYLKRGGYTLCEPCPYLITDII